MFEYINQVLITCCNQNYLMFDFRNFVSKYYWILGVLLLLWRCPFTDGYGYIFCPMLRYRYTIRMISLSSPAVKLYSSHFELDTDAGHLEQQSPWPPFMQEEVWSDRIKIRRILKEQTLELREFWGLHNNEFSSWFNSVDQQTRSRSVYLWTMFFSIDMMIDRWFQLPKDDLHMIFAEKFEIKR